MAKSVAVPVAADQKVLHVLPQEYVLDNQDGIRQPIGMAGVRLEAHVHVVTAALSATAAAGRRRAHLRRRVSGPAALARMGSNERTRRRSSASSSRSCTRSSPSGVARLAGLCLAVSSRCWPSRAP